MLPAATEMSVRPVSTAAVSTSSPDVRRPVAARQISAPYDQASAKPIATQTPANANTV